MRLSLIAAVAQNGVIGKGGDLPWRLSSDLRRFKSLTMGHPLIMGRRTWESLGRPLPGRTSIVATRRGDFSTPFDRVPIVHNFDAALAAAEQAPGGVQEAFVIGGAEMYAAAFPRADRLYLTRVLAEVEGDAWFPQWDQRQWQRVSAEQHAADDRNEFAHVFEIYDRRPDQP